MVDGTRGISDGVTTDKSSKATPERILQVHQDWAALSDERREKVRKQMGEVGAPEGASLQSVGAWWQSLRQQQPWPLPLSFLERLQSLCKTSRSPIPVLQLPDNMTEEELEAFAIEGSAEQRRAVAIHTNTAFSFLIKLSEAGFADDVDLNPMTPIYIETNPDQGRVLLEFIAQQSTRPDRLLELSTSHHDDVRAGVASNRNTPTEVLVSFASDEYWFLRAQVAVNANTPSDVAARLVHDPDESVRARIADTTEDPRTLEILSTDESEYVRQAVSINKKTPLDVLKRLKGDPSPDVQERAETMINWMHQNSKPAGSLSMKDSSQDFYNLVKEGTVDQRKYIAKNENIDARTALELFRLGFYEELEENECIPSLVENMNESELHELANSGPCRQCAIIAKHPAASLPTLLLLSKMGYAEEVDQHPLLPLYYEVGSKDAFFIYGFVANQTSNVDRIYELMSMGISKIETEIASNPYAPAALLEQLSSHQLAEVRHSVADNVNTPEETLGRLSSDPDWSVRYRVSMNFRTPKDVLEKLSVDKDPMVRKSAIGKLKERQKNR